MNEPVLPPKPQGNPFYGPLEPATLTDGWCYGYITAAPSDSHPNGCESGDGYAVAPDGSYAGLIWWKDCPWLCKHADLERELRSRQFGMFEVHFPNPVVGLDDLVRNFRFVLPALKVQHARWLRASKTAEAKEGRKAEGRRPTE